MKIKLGLFMTVAAFAQFALASTVFPAGRIREQLCYIGADKDCSFGELFTVDEPFEMTSDTAVIVTARSSVPCVAVLFWHVEEAGCRESDNGVEFGLEGEGAWRTYVLRPRSVASGKVKSVRFYSYAAKDDATAVGAVRRALRLDGAN